KLSRSSAARSKTRRAIAQSDAICRCPLPRSCSAGRFAAEPTLTATFWSSIIELPPADTTGALYARTMGGTTPRERGTQEHIERRYGAKSTAHYADRARQLLWLKRRTGSATSVLLLESKQLSDTLGGQVEQRAEPLACERPALGGPLHLDVLAGAGHH